MCVKTFTGHKGYITCLIESLDGAHIISASVDQTIKIWQITSNECTTLAGHGGSITCLAQTSFGKIISGSRDNTIKIWDFLHVKPDKVDIEKGDVLFRNGKQILPAPE